MNYWLMKSEPTTFSIEMLERSPNQTAPWDGVRNYQARNFMKQMHINDLAFFYHSSCKVPGIVGLMRVSKLAYPDFTALDPKNCHYDPKSTPEKPIWEMVDVQFVEKFANITPLKILQLENNLKDMPLVRKGNRLSIMPVSPVQWQTMMNLTERNK